MKTRMTHPEIEAIVVVDADALRNAWALRGWVECDADGKPVAEQSPE